jgi:glycosyltransferase involved in cell wall biosynthesis
MAGTHEMVDFPAQCGAGAVAIRTTPRVLLIAPYAPQGGGMGRIMAYLSAYGPQAGVQFEILESRGGGTALASGWHMVWCAARIIQVAAGRSPAIVHLNFGEGGSVVRKGLLLMLAHTLGMPTILHLHAADIVGFHAGLSGMARALTAFVFRRAGTCIVLGPLWRQWLVEKLGVTPSGVVVIHNGVPQLEVEHVKPRADGFCLVFLGNLLARKGLPDLLHALAQMQDGGCLDLPEWRLWVGGGGDFASLAALAQELGIAQRVRFLGWLDRRAATDLLFQADALVLPSYKEALPLVLLEAAGASVPVIATRVGAIPDVFTDGHDALLVAPGDRTALSAALARVMNDPDLARQLGKNAKRLYDQHFAMEIFVQAMAAVYARLGSAAR